MKLENFSLAIHILKFINNHSNCTIPQIKDDFGIIGFNPPKREEKNLYKVISYLNNSGFIVKMDNPSISQRGAHYFLRVTQKGTQIISTFKELFKEITPQSYNLSEGNSIRRNDLSTEFSKFSYGILNSLLQGLLYELPKDSRLFLRANRSKIKNLIEKSHAQLQEKVSKIIDS